MITGVNKVVLTVRDCDAAKEFWVDRMGFTVAIDAAYGEDARWLEVMSPDGAVSLVLDGKGTHPIEKSTPAELPHSNVFFTCEDIEQTHAELVERGVNFPEPPSKQPWGWWSMFEDQDGTRYALNQRG
ncbi:MULTISPECIES: VOC family protein [unclassified Crossiella]|uniref:VOC family protein n=1 Tax=unclassified Crossiella TaxID=2620835 RepID=UPI001FFF1618|nr:MULTISPECIES: VOC family protein [unclassified Crossiella]MCK2242987.1 VOC family protein [Crossiella sp. S99.2]MCK2256864.1 VOC family protein [Crossiella sp. S99.1]